MAEIDDDKLKEMEDELALLKPLKDGIKKDEFEAKQKEWEDEKKRLEEEANPNFKKMREQMKIKDELLGAKGVKLDAEGNPIVEEKFSKDDIIREAQQATTRTLLGARLDEELQNFTEEEAKVVKRQYEKLTAGEDVTMQNIRTFVNQAIGASGFDVKNNAATRTAGVSGQGPRIPVEGEDKLDDKVATEVAGMMGLKINK